MPFPAFLGADQVIESGNIVFHDKHGQLAIDVRGIRLEFEFRSNSSGQMTTQFNPKGNVIECILTNFDNPLGSSFELTGLLMAGKPIKIMFMLHTIGEPGAAMRLLSYTVS